MTVTPHQVGQLAKAEILLADRLEAWGLDDPNERAKWLLQQLQTELGWTPPRDLTQTPALRPEHVADPGHQAACMAEIRASLQAIRDRLPVGDTPPHTGAP